MRFLRAVASVVESVDSWGEYGAQLLLSEGVGCRVALRKHCEVGNKLTNCKEGRSQRSVATQRKRLPGFAHLDCKNDVLSENTNGLGQVQQSHLLSRTYWYQRVTQRSRGETPRSKGTAFKEIPNGYLP